MAFEPISFKNTKHILRAANFLRDLVMRQAVTLNHMGERWAALWPSL